MVTIDLAAFGVCWKDTDIWRRGNVGPGQARAQTRTEEEKGLGSCERDEEREKETRGGTTWDGHRFETSGLQDVTT